MAVSFIGGGNRRIRHVASHYQTLSHNVAHIALIEIRNSVVIGTDCIGSCKSNYYKIMAKTDPCDLQYVTENCNSWYTTLGTMLMRMNIFCNVIYCHCQITFFQCLNLLQIFYWCYKPAKLCQPSPCETYSVVDERISPNTWFMRNQLITFCKT